MKFLCLSAGIILALSGCAAAPQMTWGKPGVSAVDYGTDLGTCTGLAAKADPGTGANTAGGIDGKAIANTNNPPAVGTPPPANGGTPAQTTHVEAPLPAGGSYSGMASADFAQRAATQQRAQEMAVQRVRAETFRSCLAGRGYQEIELTAAQRTQLATLEKGSREYLEYLYTIGSDPEVMARQAVPAR